MVTYSIIIPHRNIPQLLNRCINSIPCRSDIEIIVIDDNSSPNLKPLLLRDGVQLINLDTTQSKGAGYARNVGLSVASGKWLLFADADDYFVDGFIDILDNYVSEDIDVLYYGYNFIDGKSNRILNNEIGECAILAAYENNEYNNDHIRFKNYAPWSKMVRREYVNKHNFKFEEVMNGNDMLFSLLVASNTENYLVERSPIYVYVKTDDSLTTGRLSIEAHMCRIEHYMKLKEFYKVINRTEWATSVIRYICYIGKSEGLVRFVKLFMTYLFKYPGLYNRRKMFIEITNIGPQSR